MRLYLVTYLLSEGLTPHLGHVFILATSQLEALGIGYQFVNNNNSSKMTINGVSAYLVSNPMDFPNHIVTFNLEEK